MKISLFLCLITAVFSVSSQAANYYVATDGSDSNPGTLQNPWRNINYAAGLVKPGDTVYVRGGTYYETVTSRVSGTASQRVTFKAYQNETPIIDGTARITGWVKCSSSSDFLRPNGTSIGSFTGNPNYNNIYKATVSSDDVANPSTLSVYEDGEYLFASSSPIQSNNVFDDETTYKPMSSSSYNQKAYLIDSSLTQPNDYWNGSTVKVWVHQNNNNVTTKTVADFIAAEDKIVFSSSLPANLGNTGSMPDAYVLQNHWSLLNKKGTVYMTTTPVNGQYTVYVWPNNPANIENSITVSKRDNGFWMSSGSYVTIDGFVIRGVSKRSDTATHRSGGIANTSGWTHTGLHIRNCTIKNSACYGGITLWAGKNDIIENNRIENCRSGYGIACRGTSTARNSGCIIRNNTIKSVRSTGLKIIYATDIQITGNTASEFGSHANGCSIYQFNENVLFAHNRITDARNALTLKESKNVTVYSNILEGSGSTADGNYILAAWSAGSGTPMSGQVAILNNIILSKTGTISLYISNSPQTQADWIIKNNIIDGYGWDTGINPDMTNNIYVDYGWQQKKSTYSLSSGEYYYTNLDQIFIDRDALNFDHVEGGYAIDKGISVQSYLPTSAFPDYDYQVDIASTSRTTGARIDIGAYEGAGDTGGVIDPPVAKAGSNQTVLYKDKDSVQLDASQSTGYGTLSYKWSYNGTVITGKTPTISLSTAGDHQILLTVSDGQTPPVEDTDTVTITVEAEVVVTPPDEPDFTSLRSGLVGEWLFSDSDGSVARDTSGNSNNVTLSDENMWHEDSCLDFSSADTYLTTPASDALNLSGSLAISAWINPRTFGQGNYGRIVDKGVGSASRGFSLLLNGSNADIGYLTYGGDYVSSTDNVISLNTWTHVCATYDKQAQTVSFYVNGQPAGTSAYTRDPVSTANDPLYIGLRGYTESRNFDGQIDGVRIYSRPVSEKEALLLYQSGRGGDLVGKWKLDQFTGATAADESEYNNQATLVNNPIWGKGWAKEEFLKFSGNHEALQIPTYGWNKNEGTISMWVTPASSNSFQFLFGHMLDSTNRIFIYTNNGKLALGLGDSSATDTNIATLAPNEAYHVALTWKDADYALCLDGRKVSEGTFSGFTEFNTFADVGNYGNETIRDDYNLSWDGTVDDVSIYRRALQDEEIQRLCHTHEAKDNSDFELTLGGSGTYTAGQLPSGATFDVQTQTLKWRPRFDQAGDHVILFISEDGLDRQSITISVKEKPTLPWYEDFLKYKGVK